MENYIISDNYLAKTTGISGSTIAKWKIQNEQNWRYRIYNFLKNYISLTGDFNIDVVQIAIEIEVQNIEHHVQNTNDRTLLMFAINSCSFPELITPESRHQLQIELNHNFEVGLKKLLHIRKNEALWDTYSTIVYQLSEPKLQFLFLHYPQIAYLRHYQYFIRQNQKNDPLFQIDRIKNIFKKYLRK